VFSVELGGETRPFKWGTNATRILSGKVDKDLHELDLQSNIIEQAVLVIYSGLYAGAKSEGKEIDFTEWEVSEWIDELSQDQYEKLDADINKHIEDNKSPVLEDAKKKYQKILEDSLG